MSEIVNQLAQLPLPQELTQQLDLPELVINFQKNFKNLDNFKNVRDKHASRGVGKKVWDFLTLDKTLENAQLDAVEVQASFSKAIGQLMVISIAQSQYLTEQQVQLIDQQNKLREQAGSIEKHNEILEKQHEELADSNVRIEKLVNEYFELKGLTAEGAKKLIEIANEVKDTRDQLLLSVEESLSEMLHRTNDSEERTKVELTNTRELVKCTHDETKDQMDARFAAQDEKIFSVQGEFKFARADMIKRSDEVITIFDRMKVQHELELSQIAKQLTGHQSYLQKQLKILQISLGASVFLSIVLFVFLFFR